MIDSAYKLMKSLLKLADSDDDDVWIDYENERFVRVHNASDPLVFVPFPASEPSVHGLIKYLHDEGCISPCSNPEYFSLTYKAFYYDEFHKEECRDFRRKSFFIPFAVAVFGNILVELFKATSPFVLQSFLRLMQ